MLLFSVMVPLPFCWWWRQQTILLYFCSVHYILLITYWGLFCLSSKQKLISDEWGSVWAVLVCGWWWWLWMCVCVCVHVLTIKSHYCCCWSCIYLYKTTRNVFLPEFDIMLCWLWSVEGTFDTSFDWLHRLERETLRSFLGWRKRDFEVFSGL